MKRDWPYSTKKRASSSSLSNVSSPRCRTNEMKRCRIYKTCQSLHILLSPETCLVKALLHLIRLAKARGDLEKEKLPTRKQQAAISYMFNRHGAPSTLIQRTQTLNLLLSNWLSPLTISWPYFLKILKPLGVEDERIFDSFCCAFQILSRN